MLYTAEERKKRSMKKNPTCVNFFHSSICQKAGHHLGEKYFIACDCFALKKSQAS
jgi:hypothetical protein